MKQYRVVAYLFTALLMTPLSVHAGENVLSNSSFETAASLGTRFAQHFAWDHPDQDGSYWGSAIRTNWRSHAGSWEGAIPGTWRGLGDYGGFWQQKPASPGLSYEASGWFWADNGGGGGFWSAVEQNIKIEFIDATDSIISSAALEFHDVGETWTQKAVSAVAPANTVKARWVIAVGQAGSDGAFQFDEVSLRRLSVQSQNFNTWTSQTSYGCHLYEGWTLCTGRTTAVNARSGYAAELGNAGTISNQGHYLESDLIDDGIGTVRFWYRHIDGSSPGVDYVLQTSTDSTNWTTVTTLDGVTNTTYEQFSYYIFEPASRYVRLLHTNGQNAMLVDDFSIEDPSSIVRFQDFDSWPEILTDVETNIAEWVISTGRVNTTSAKKGNTAKLAPSTASNHFIRSPLFTEGVGEVSFSYRHADGVGSPISFALQTSTDQVNWVTVDQVSNITTAEYTEYSHYMFEEEATSVRILYETGNKYLFVDCIDVAFPNLFRTQDFDDWPTEDTTGVHEFQGWTLATGIVDDAKAVAGQSGRLRTGGVAGFGQHIQSPFLPDGVGPISFYYVVEQTNMAPPSNIDFNIETSPDGTNWTVQDTLDGITNHEFQLYSEFFNLETGLIVRIMQMSGARRTAFDEIEVLAPQDAADVNLLGRHDPVSPFTNDQIQLLATISPQNGANSITATSYYRAGTSGVFTAIPMEVTNFIVYTSESLIPAQPTGTVVQYYIEANFGGPAANVNLPKYYPEGGPTNPAQILIPRNTPGRAWINELNYVNMFFGGDDTNEFVELAAPVGWDISGWSVELAFNASTVDLFSVYATYTFPDGTIISNGTRRIGYHLVGDAQLTAAVPDVELDQTNSVDLTHISDGFGIASGVRLLNEGGGVEQSLSYEKTLSGFTKIDGSDLSFGHSDPNSIQLTGGGGGFDDFSWSTNTYTPGTVNSNEFIVICPDDLSLACTNGVPAADTNDVLTDTYCTGGHVDITLVSETNNAGTACNGSPLVIVRMYRAIDNCGNTNDCVQTITMEDSVGPTITPPADTDIDCAASTHPDDTGWATATEDNCSSVVSTSYTDAVDTDCPITITRTWEAVDMCGNTSTVDQVITLMDTTDPVLSGVPADTTVECEPPLPTVTVSDNCDTNVSIMYSATTNGTLCSGTVERVWSAMDACGNNVTSTQTITVIDTNAPALLGVPTNETVNCSNGIPAAAHVTARDCPVEVVTNELAAHYNLDSDQAAQLRDGTANENHGTIEGAPMQVDGYSGGGFLLDGDDYFQLTNSISLQPTNLTISLWIKPTNTINSGVFAFFSKEATNGTGGYALEYADGKLDFIIGETGTTHSMQLPYVFNMDQWHHIAASYDGVSQRAYVDGIEVIESNITANIRHTSIAPRIGASTETTPSLFFKGIMDEVRIYNRSISSNEVLELASEPVKTNAVSHGSTTNSSGCTTVITNTWSATDNCGNSVGVTQVVTVVDDTPPVFTNMPTNITVECDSIPSVPSDVGAEDACDTNVLSVSFSATTNGSCPTIIDRMWSATDVCGNTGTSTQRITVVDTTAPSITNVPADATVECDAVPGDPTDVGVFDACDTNVTLYYVATTNGTCPTTIMRLWSATDTCDNAVSATQIVTVADTMPPVITNCPTNIMVETTNDVPAADTNLVGGTDNCTPVLLIAHVSDADDGGSGNNGDPKTITRTYSVLDECGNGSNCVQLIVVEASESDAGMVEFYEIELGTNISFKSTESSNGWRAVPYYLTNLLVSPQDWVAITNYNVVTNGGTNMIWFDYPAGVEPIFIRIGQTNEP